MSVTHNFMDSIQQNIRRSKVKQYISGIVTAASMQTQFDDYLTKNRFRMSIATIADTMLLSMRNYIDTEYLGKGLELFKYPEYGVSNDFSFTFLGNEEYEDFIFDKYYESGIVYTGQTKSIIPKPMEEVKPQEILFRTSKGELIHGDPFVDEYVADQMGLYSTQLSRIYEQDAHSFLRTIGYKI